MEGLMLGWIWWILKKIQGVNGRIIKVLATIDLEKPLLRGTTISLGGRTRLVDFKYEQLMGFCYYCGLVGHSERGCEKEHVDIQKEVVTEGQYGDWLRAYDRRPLGKKFEERGSNSPFPPEKREGTERDHLDKSGAVDYEGVVQKDHQNKSGAVVLEGDVQMEDILLNQDTREKGNLTYSEEWCNKDDEERAAINGNDEEDPRLIWVSQLVDSENKRWKKDLILQNFNLIDAEAILKIPLNRMEMDDDLWYQAFFCGSFILFGAGWSFG
ncbi:HERV-K_19q12 provirus ancestral Gag polyprotein [Striga asiatica]|uniref:HERV-K_19q12 provirus ancestral Gag polyprotein n=1 Tax=Striga asiatica TaxID=4170 RepID=A0A5A7PED0_STRAF|nr:HERV-K_19q12 provirus ancestral Gag polyprotein [Striga asiatica]